MSASEGALQARVKALEEEVERLQAQLRGKSDGAQSDKGTSSVSKVQENGGNRKKGKRVFDFAAHPRRHVALRLAYLGWQYQGFAVQENTDNTVEARVFEALLKTKLIQDRQSSNYHRCGRTDKGVSAFSQVISIDLRSSQFSGLGVTVPAGVEPKAGSGAATTELPYVKMLNRVLPPDIRALSWSPVPSGFSARFDCQSRTYRYYFPRGNLDVELMAEAVKRYEGTHDFRNLCKMDVGNGVLQFQRTITAASVQPCEPRHPSHADPQRFYMFEVKGLAFLYHQVRCMMAVLLLIGQKLEAPEIITQLLDVENNPRKPQYRSRTNYAVLPHGGIQTAQLSPPAGAAVLRESGIAHPTLCEKRTTRAGRRRERGGWQRHLQGQEVKTLASNELHKSRSSRRESPEPKGRSFTSLIIILYQLLLFLRCT
ncbi:tRNA pseudouridine(38/39) synthase isoform X2 [Neoarius graeffei]|uniref:tRNA pseudouridine(38/39) synthase isoform X2 n=1 Tax=Neoarius graeffei TaxID=443677 RepID=UPI00298BD1DC|nr:tRNA pseudouridine(38/39) synthase isoform X2 [Neoarius graeffei]